MTSSAGEIPPAPAVPWWARWWVLFLTCVMAAMQCAQWAVPGPIAGSLQTLYGLDAATVQLLLNYGPFVFLATSIPYALAMRASPSGLRASIVTAIACTAASAVVRLGCRDAGAASMAALHISFILNAAAGPPAMACVTQLTELWFAPAERATATAIAVEANVVGAALAFIAGPLLVPQGAPTQAQFDRYTAIFVAICGANLLGAALYFPLSPAAPPSLSAAYRERQQRGEAEAAKAAAAAGAAAAAPKAVASVVAAARDGATAALLALDDAAAAAARPPPPSLARLFWREHVALARNRRFMLLCATAGFLNGAMSAWSSTLSISGAPFGIDNIAAGWIGAIQSLGGNFTGIAACAFLDRVHVHKTMMLACSYLSVMLLLTFGLQTQRMLPAALLTPAGLWVTASISGVALNTAWPVFYDASADEAFPVPEATSLTLLTNFYNLITLVFLFVPLQTPAQSAQFTWIIAGCSAAAVVALHLFYSPELLRRAVDDGTLDADETAAAKGVAGGDEAATSALLRAINDAGDDDSTVGGGLENRSVF